MVIHHVTRASRHLIFWSVLALALLMTLLRLLLADIGDYKQHLEQQLRQTSQLPLRIGHISAGMRGFSPHLTLRDLSLEDAAAPGLQLQELRVGIDPLQWLLGGDALAATWVSLIGARLELILNPDDSITLKGLQGGDEQPLWLLQGRQYELLQSDITWLDHKNHHPPVHLPQVDLVLKNQRQDDSHELHLVAHLPPQWGDRLRLSTRFTGNPLQAHGFNGLLYLEGDNLQAPALLADLLPDNLRLHSGSGDIRIWSQWRDAQPYQLATALQAQQIQLQQGKAALQLDTLEGTLNWLQSADGWRLQGDNIDIVSQHQRAADAAFIVQHRNSGEWSGDIQQLDVGALNAFMPLLVANNPQAAAWANRTLHGKLHGLRFFVPADNADYAVQGHFHQLGIDASSNSPGLLGLSGSLRAHHSGGQVLLASDHLTLDAPQWLRQPITLNRIAGTVAWQAQPQHWQISSHDLSLDSPDFATRSAFDLRLPHDGSSPHLALMTTLDDFNQLQHLPHYLPAKVMGQSSVEWLDQAFLSGRITRGEIVVDGPLAQFPFPHNEGRFDTLLHIDNTVLQFNPDWPALQDLDAEVHFSGEDLRVAINHGHSDQVAIEQALVNIPQLAESVRAYVYGQLHSPLNAALQYMQHSPLRRRAEPLIKVLDSNSPVQLDLNLSVPYYNADPLSVQVDLQLHDSQLLLKPVALAVKHINGSIRFTEDSISSPPIHAETLGFPIQTQLSSGYGATRLHVNGSTSVSQLQQQFSFLQSDQAHGALTYQADLLIPDGVGKTSTLSISSDLKGVTLDGNEWLSKTTEQAQPLQLDFAFDNQALMPLQLRYGSQVSAALLIDTNDNHLHSAQIAIGEPVAVSNASAGIGIRINQAQFKLASLLSSVGDSDSRWPPLREVAIDTQQLLWQGQSLGALHCRFLHSNHAWQGHIDSDMAKGKITLPDQRGGSEAIKLDMDSLNLSALSELDIKGADEVVTVLPLLAIDSQQLWWRGINLGTVQLQTERLLNGVHFKKISVNSPGKHLDLTADWTKQLNGTSTQLRGTLKLDSFGQLLSDSHISDDFKETHAEFALNANWNGAPQALAFEQLNGTLQAKLWDGRIASIEPGLGRLLGLLALEQWVKRLSLDFSDIYRQGLAFNKITGSFKINNGLAYSNDLQVDAIAANMRLVGSANLPAKTLDFHVAVVPKSSSALPIAGTIVGNIAAVITNALTSDYKEGYFFGSEYKLAGHWDDIEVTAIPEEAGLVNKTWRGLTEFNWLP